MLKTIIVKGEFQQVDIEIGDVVTYTAHFAYRPYRGKARVTGFTPNGRITVNCRQCPDFIVNDHEIKKVEKKGESV